MKNFIYILMLFMASVVLIISLDYTNSFHVKITDLDDAVLYDAVLVDVLDTVLVENYHMRLFYPDDYNYDLVEFLSRCLEFDNKDKSFYLEIKEKSDSNFHIIHSVTPYVNGKRHGDEKGYYESGELKWEIPFVNGKVHGVKKEYYESGELKGETPYVNGKKHGVVREYSSKGKVLYTANYKNGVLDGYKR